MQKLELTWIGKGKEPQVEPRILLHDASKDYGDPAADNMLIHGDNLLALKALEQEFAGRVKCIYIDPPYNTGSAFEHYDDGVEHSIWLNLMKARLDILKILLSNDGDLVLDSFLGSGTTAAVAHKMGRRYIGIELGDHCYTHCLPRLKTVVDGEQGGISKAMEWQGGGGFKFYELAPTLIVKDSHGNSIISDKYNAEMLVAAIAKLNGFTYSPDSECFWKQGKAQGNSYSYVTTQYLTAKDLDDIAREVADFETLAICAPAFDIGLGKRYDNITVKKIPQSILAKCEYGVDHYNLNIVDVAEFEDWEDADDE
jgi:hypothetical protein